MRLYMESEETRREAQARVIVAFVDVAEALEELRRAEVICERMYDEGSAGLPMALGVLIASKHSCDLADRRLRVAIDAHTQAMRQRTVETEMVP